MKLLFFLLLILTISESHAQSETISLTDYKITIPEGWTPLPDEQIASLQKLSPPKLRSYIIGYTSDSTDDYAPYFISIYNEIPGIENALFKDVIIQQLSIINESDFSINLTVDSLQYKFYNEFELKGKYVYNGYAPGGTGIVYFQYFTNDAEKDKNEFLSIYNSISHLLEFQNRNYYHEKAKEHQSKAGQHAILALIAFCVFLLITWYNIRRKKEA